MLNEVEEKDVKDVSAAIHDALIRHYGENDINAMMRVLNLTVMMTIVECLQIQFWDEAATMFHENLNMGLNKFREFEEN